jgi:hypothetical protein
VFSSKARFTLFYEKKTCNNLFLWHQCNPSDIEEKLLERNIRHFGQAEGTLFTRDDFKQHFAYDGTTTIVTQLINGQFDLGKLDNLTEGARALLNKLSTKPCTTFLDDEITYDEFKTAFQKWSEGTSTSPSGHHLGHYKVLLCSDNNNDKYDEVNQDPRDKIM